MPNRALVAAGLACFLLSISCTSCGGTALTLPTVVDYPQATIYPTVPSIPVLANTPAPSPTTEPSPTPRRKSSLWISSAVPESLRIAATHIQDLPVSAQLEQDNLVLGPAQTGSNGTVMESATWIYALVVPFPTIADGTSFNDLQESWRGSPSGIFTDCHLAMDTSTEQAMRTVFGDPARDVVRVIRGDGLLDQAWQDRHTCSIVPFEELQPRWKVLRIDGVSPYDRDFDPQRYPLKVTYQVTVPSEVESWYERDGNRTEPGLLPEINRDPEKFTLVVVTGVTALVRATAWEMDTRGILFPAETIGDILRDADITHISNEISFSTSCPPGDPNTASLRFCSKPEYLQLLESVGTDVIELTGNHLNDFGSENLSYTLELYRDHDLQVFAGGETQNQAREALLLEDHGNKIAFIGCNMAGPPADWATEASPGSASCDLDWESSEITRLRSDGYLVIATFQYMESYDHVPGLSQQRDFRKVAEAGATIVSGSQAHYPQAFEFDQSTLIHYGLGNLFFDQMNPVINGLRYPGTRREFIDRHIFYDGRYLGTDLVTAMLEDYARPRLMTPEERQDLLTDIFAASGW